MTAIQHPRTTTTSTGHGAGCACPACQGLASLVRPRFFAGQVLTEVDLMALERYAVDAHRMHNRYLHGWGVVCGLEVGCEDCGDGLVLQPGYALDPCGRDLVVPSPQSIPVAQLIRDCLDAERAAPVCDPPQTGPPKGCPTDEHWCVTLRYRESPVRPVTPLAGNGNGASKCSCGNGNGGGCHCGGAATTAAAGWNCTCGASRSTQACGCTSYVSSPDLPPGCEPTRVVECFDVGVCRCDGDCCTLAQAVEGTFPVRALECVTSLTQLLGKRLSAKEQKATAVAALGDIRRSDSAYARDGICKLYDAVLDLYQRDPLRSMCQLPREFGEVDCSPQREDESSDTYSQRLVTASQTLVLLVVAYVRDCVCHALNPPCPDPCDERIRLGCFTYQDGKVLDICNLECRRYAGSFVSRRYWVPIGPVVLWALGVLCCFPIVGRTRDRRLVSVQRMLALGDPDRTYRNLLARDDYAITGTWRAGASKVTRRLLAVPSWLPRPSTKAVNLAGLEGEHVGAVQETLVRSKIDPVVVELDDPDAVPLNRLTFVPVVEPGERVQAFVYKGRVVGFAPEKVSDARRG
ncbi:hypothetical protein [Solirubrobacter soli]|uniref:hypothetical protein n=1 Tax=Solirubrobacter soli TaxID=363832 RepID=UPI000408ED78|nr:hypothetical protein [Solirubrobacter soli]